MGVLIRVLLVLAAPLVFVVMLLRLPLLLLTPVWWIATGSRWGHMEWTFWVTERFEEIAERWES